jgi:hypothetical protein
MRSVNNGGYFYKSVDSLTVFIIRLSAVLDPL